MSKQLPYFQFEPAEYLTSDISICSLEAQGLFILMCSFYWQKDCSLKKDKFLKRHNHPDQLKELIDEGIIKVNNEGFIQIKFLKIQHHFISEKKLKNSKNGVKGALQRIKNQEVIKPPLSDTSSQAQATPKHLDKIREDKRRVYNNNILPDAKASKDNSSLNNQSPPQEKGKEKSSAKKESFDWKKLIDFFNEKTGLKKQVVSNKVKGQLNARLKEGYVKQDVMNTIINGSKSKYHIESNYEYFTLEYISRSDTIDKYSAVRNDSEKIKLGMNI